MPQPEPIAILGNFQECIADSSTFSVFIGSDVYYTEYNGVGFVSRNTETGYYYTCYLPYDYPEYLRT